MDTTPNYTLTNESLTIIWEGKPYTVRKGAPNYLALRTAILNEDWKSVPDNLTVKKSLREWARGKYVFNENGRSFSFNGEEIPGNINRRIIEMATRGEDPTPLFRFWGRLQRNPSFRSVQQLFNFLTHEGIPIVEDGCFLAYKSVRSDYRDHHSGMFLNKPGSVLEMPRNKISDDPQVPCHDGFHVGAKSYADSFGAGDRRIVICKVDPADVVCVPYDESQRKMRVCKYEVVGNSNGETLPSTTFRLREADEIIGAAPTSPELNDAEKEEVRAGRRIVAIKMLRDRTNLSLKESIDIVTAFQGAVGATAAVTAPPHSGDPKQDTPLKVVDLMADEADKDVHAVRKSNKGFTKFDKMGTEELMKESIEDLRRYAGKGLEIIGASKIPGGKTALVARILAVRE